MSTPAGLAFHSLERLPRYLGLGRLQLFKNTQRFAEKARRFRFVALSFRQPSQLVQGNGDAALVAESLLDLQALIVELPRLL